MNNKKNNWIITFVVLAIAIVLLLVYVLNRRTPDTTAPAPTATATLTAEPTVEQAATVSPTPTATPTAAPTPTDAPTLAPTAAPAATPTAQATEAVTETMAEAEPTEAPPVDDFTVTLVNGETFSLSEHRGKIVMVDLWATWCPPCLSSMPSVQELADEYADRVVILGVNCGDKAADVKDFVEKNGYTFPIAIDEDLDILYNHFPTSGIPYTVFIDAEGKLFTTHLGGGADVYDKLKATIEEVLLKTPVDAGTNE